MLNTFTLSQFNMRFPNDDACLEEVKRLRYQHGIACKICQTVTRHYKLNNRPAYCCKVCRNQIYPLAGTVFEKTTTPLSLWFYCMFLMTHTRAAISIKQLQRELGVTYKTAWRMYRCIKTLMEQNNSDLLTGTFEIDETDPLEQGINRVFKWVFFNKIEFKVVQRQQSSK